jgi:hypothetical protein
MKPKIGHPIVPVSLIKNDDLVTTRRQRDLLLGKHLDVLTNDVDAPFVGCIQLQDGLSVLGPKQCMGETENAGRFPDPRRPLHAERAKRKQAQRCRTEMITLGMFPCLAIMRRRSSVSSLPTMSDKACGRYFSILHERDMHKTRQMGNYHGSSMPFGDAGTSSMTRSLSSMRILSTQQHQKRRPMEGSMEDELTHPNDPYYAEMCDTVQSLKCCRTFVEHSLNINSFDFCDLGVLALTAGEDDMLVVYDALQAKFALLPVSDGSSDVGALGKSRWSLARNTDSD